jgi:hypothetical protein
LHSAIVFYLSNLHHQSISNSPLGLIVLAVPFPLPRTLRWPGAKGNKKVGDTKRLSRWQDVLKKMQARMV